METKAYKWGYVSVFLSEFLSVLASAAPKPRSTLNELKRAKDLPQVPANTVESSDTIKPEGMEDLQVW